MPEIRMKHGWLLQGAFMKYREVLPAGHAKGEEPSVEEMRAIVAEREALWRPVGEQILQAMQDITGLTFRKNIIDVYTVFGYSSAFSDPLVMGLRYKGDHFIDTLTHELLHTLLSDNTQNINSFIIAKKRFPEITDVKALRHIILHAVHKEIYLNVLTSPERLRLDIERDQKHSSYKLAWDVVEQFGHDNIIALLKGAAQS